MKQNILSALSVVLAVCCIGCSADYYATQIIEHNTSSGRVELDLTGTGKQMIDRGHIDVHRRIEVSQKVSLDVWVIKARSDENQAPAAGGTVLILHGLGKSKASPPQLGLSKRLATMGYDVVLPDLRAHGRSDGEYVTFGALEHRDVRIVIDRLIEDAVVHPDIYAFGTNLGATTAIMYAADDPRCKGVVAIAPYKDTETVARAIVKFWSPMMSEEDFQKALARAGKIAGFDPAGSSAVVSAGKLTCPLLVIHGLLDLSVSVDQGKTICQAASGPKKFIMLLPHEQLALAIVMEDWLAKQIDSLVKTGLKDQVPQTQPSP